MFYPQVLRCAGVLLLSAFLSYGGESDALAIDAVIQARHVPYGTVLNPIYSSDGRQIVNYTRCGDSAIWTGHYLAAEAYRFAVTGAPQALANLRGALAGLTLLEAAQVLDVSDNTANRDWAYAKAWLHRELADAAAAPELEQ